VSFVALASLFTRTLPSVGLTENICESRSVDHRRDCGNCPRGHATGGQRPGRGEVRVPPGSATVAITHAVNDGADAIRRRTVCQV